MFYMCYIRWQTEPEKGPKSTYLPRQLLLGKSTYWLSLVEPLTHSSDTHSTPSIDLSYTKPPPWVGFGKEEEGIRIATLPCKKNPMGYALENALTLCSVLAILDFDFLSAA